MNTDIIQYQNANQSEEEIIKNFIVRQKEFARVMDDIRSTDEGSSFQHYIFVGSRGSGKSTLLRRIQVEFSLEKALKQQYVVVNLSEEQSAVYKLYDLWDYVIRDLNAMGFNIEKKDFRSYAPDMKSYTIVLHSQIISALQTKKKRLILLIDNFDRIIDSVGNDEDASLLRELLMNHKDIRIIGGSTVMSEHFWKYDKPFFQFFSIKKLESLSLEEVKKLLEFWSDKMHLPELAVQINKHPGKIESIRMLTDGMPRTMLLFVDMMINRPEQNGYHYLQLIVDKATPIYQERLSRLSPAQKKVLSELAYFWDAASVDELIPKCNMDGKTISALLNQLTQSKYVVKIKGATKNLLYRLEERFFNLWFIMTQGGIQQRLEAKALADFLEKWYDQADIQPSSGNNPYGIHSWTDKKAYDHWMSGSSSDNIPIANEVSQTAYVSIKNKKKTDVLKRSDQERFTSGFEEPIKKAIEDKNYVKGLELIQNAELDEGVRNYWMAIYYEHQKKFSDAEKYYLHAIQLGNVKALNDLSSYFYKQNKIQKIRDLFNQISKEMIGLFLKSYRQFAVILYLYSGKMDLFIKLAQEELTADKIVLDEFILSLLIHKQNNLVFNYFEINPKAKEHYKPLFYATLKLKGGMDQTLLKMPPEISQNVDDIISFIRTKQDFYYG
ncbi:MAG TPA: ATP-binding protein [Saprospiraceae bacterium]|nr:hypothetical protein [Saprospirales bacterium]HRQ28756.1 ATP-binding protein [Saprospiraceae bacterium]